MRIQVHLFAAASQIARSRTVVVDCSPGSTLAHVAAQLQLTYPDLANLIAVSRWAVDQQFAPLETIVTEHQEIALIPPVSGG